MKNPLKYFSEVSDPRVERNREHRLDEILLIAIAAVLSGAESWNDIAEFGREKLAWLRTFLTLPGGIPSHDTFNRVFAALDPEQLEAGFVAWVSSLARLTAGGVVAIDGKTLRGTRETGSKALVHMVSAWSEAHNLVLGQRKVDEKSNEIKAIPKLIEALELAGTVVTVDAMGCQREIARPTLPQTCPTLYALVKSSGLVRWKSAKAISHQPSNSPGHRGEFRVSIGMTMFQSSGICATGITITEIRERGTGANRQPVPPCNRRGRCNRLHLRCVRHASRIKLVLGVLVS
jgi:predicted transposase YbfD/YdcC